MARLKIDDILKTLNEEDNIPCDIRDYGDYISDKCPLKDGEECTADMNHEKCWLRLFEIKKTLRDKNLTLEEYKEGQKMKTEKKPRAKGKRVTSEELLAVDCWSNKFYNEAYDIVKNRLWPIVIPSYNRPEPIFLKWVNKVMVPGNEYPIFIVVRQSQKEMYENSELIKYKDYVHVKAFPDELIDDLGKTREQIVRAFSKKYDCIFMADDDVTSFAHTVPWFRSNGEPKAATVHPINFGKTMAMWQLASEYIIAKYDVAMTTIMQQGFSWVPDFINVEKSVKMMCGTNTGTVCLNLKKLKELDLNYRTSRGNGHEDFDMMIRGIEKNMITAHFRWMTYGCTAMTQQIGDDAWNSLEKRFTQLQAEMKENFGHLDYLKWTHVRGLDNIGINWNKVRKLYKTREVIDFTDEYCFNIWRDGQLLEDAKNNYINV